MPYDPQPPFCVQPFVLTEGQPEKVVAPFNCDNVGIVNEGPGNVTMRTIEGDEVNVLPIKAQGGFAITGPRAVIGGGGVLRHRYNKGDVLGWFYADETGTTIRISWVD